MIGGPAAAVERLTPIFRTLAPGRGATPPVAGRDGHESTADEGFLHCGPSGAGHFVKMVHNGIEYGMMQAYAEGFELLEATDWDLDLAAIADLWNQGSVVRSWLLELAERAFAEDGNDLANIRGYVEDSGEGRWTVQEAIDLDVPAPVITLSLLERFHSRRPELFSAKVLAALRKQFGGHAVKTKE